MDAYHHQLRFTGSGDPPPPPQQPPHHSHPSAHWYPAPPPPYPPHPGHPYPPQHHQWGPHLLPDLQHQHQRHPPPPQQQPYAYQPPPPPVPMQQPPPPPGNPWPPHHAAGQPPPPSYPPPPPGQAWTNHSWAQNHGYPEEGHGNGEDWATKAKEWAAAKSVTQNHQIQQHAISTSRTESHQYGYRDQYQQPAGLPTEVTEPLHPPVPQSSNNHLPFPMTGQQRETNHLLDRGPVASPAQSFGSFPSTYEQEVSYNYSSASGNGNMLKYPNSQAQSFSTASSVQDGFPQAPTSIPVVPSAEQPPFGHVQQSVDPSDQPLEFNSRKAGSSLAPNSDVVASSAHSWAPSATVGFLPRAPVLPQAAQMDPSVHAAPLFGAASSSNYVPPVAFGVGNVTEMFPTDPNIHFGVAEKSKKPPVPNWLREELLKKKSAPLSASVQQSTNINSMESNDVEQPLGRPDQSDSKSNDSTKSTEDDEDDEDEVEAARMAAINQEIKRVLTEVLLKVTDDLFDEIATKVLNEDDSLAESNESTGVFGSKNEPDLGGLKTKTSAKVVIPAKPTNMSSSDHKASARLSSPKGALLGLASYDSDDDDDDGDGKDKILISNLSSEIKAGAADTEEGNKSALGKRHGNHNEKNNPSLGNTSSGKDLKSINKNFQISTNAEPEGEHIHDSHNGGFPVDVKTFVKSKDVVDKMDENIHGYAEGDTESRKASSGKHAEKYNDLESSRLGKRSNGNLVKEVKTDHIKERESSTAEKYNNDSKYNMHGNLDKRSSFKEGKGSARTSNYEPERQSRGSYKQDGAKGDRKELSKDTRERSRDSIDGKGGKVNDEKDERSRQMTKSSTSHSSRRSRSRSPRGRSRTRKENSSHARGSVSSDEPSDSVKKRKHHSRKNSMSPSPTKSRNRRLSRSPHSKHSHRRHSPYSSGDRKRRSRSRTPVKRR